MAGISTNFYKFSSLMAVVALLLGLLVTGCSEGDSTPGHVDYDTDSAGLDIIVGLADPSAKGFDVDANADIFYVDLLDAENNVVGQELIYAENESEGVLAYKVLEDNARLLAVDVAAENVDKVAAVIVSAADKDKNLLGFYVYDTLELQAGRTETLDFTAEDAPAFMTVDEILAKAELVWESEPEAVDGLVTLAVGEKANITASIVTKLTDKVTYTEAVPLSHFTMTTESTDIAIDDEAKTIEGVNATEAATVTLAYGKDILTTTINVKVTGDEPGPEYVEMKIWQDMSTPMTDERFDSLATKTYVSKNCNIPLAIYGKIVDGGTTSYEKVEGATFTLEDASSKFTLDENNTLIVNEVAYGEKATIIGTYTDGDSTQTAQITFYGYGTIMWDPESTTMTLHSGDNRTVNATVDAFNAAVTLSSEDDLEGVLELNGATMTVPGVMDSKTFTITATAKDNNGVVIGTYTYQVTAKDN